MDIVAERQRIRLQDERTAIRRMLRDQARKETFLETVVRRAAEKIEPLGYKPKRKTDTDGGVDLIIHLTDTHYGINISNNWNTYNQEILRLRLCEFLDRIFEIQERHKAENAILLLGGDLISGGIHPTLRIENNEDLIDQVLGISDYLADFAAELSTSFKQVSIYLVPGNHGRIQANKDENLTHENLDNLILPFIKEKLQNYKNVSCLENKLEGTIAVFHCRGNLVFASHGDKDPIKKATERLTMLFGTQPDLIYLGHLHSNALNSQSKTKIIQSGSLSGMDAYCVDKRISGRPEQTVSVIGESGLVCLYNINFRR